MMVIDMIKNDSRYRSLINIIRSNIDRDIVVDRVNVPCVLDGSPRGYLPANFFIKMQVKKNLEVRLDKKDNVLLCLNLNKGKIDYYEDNAFDNVTRSFRSVLGEWGDSLHYEKVRRYFTKDEADLIFSIKDLQNTNYFKELVKRTEDVVKNGKLECTLGYGEFPDMKDRTLLPLVKINFDTSRVSYYSNAYARDYKKGRSHCDLKEFMDIEYEWMEVPINLISYNIKHKYIELRRFSRYRYKQRGETYDN